MKKIPEGYKQTEIGVIPEDWDVKKVGDCLIRLPRYGIGAAAVGYSDRLPKYIRITDISETGRFLPKKTVSVDNIFSANYFLSEGDLVVARTGASVGKSYLYRPKDGPLVFAGFLICLSSRNNILLPQHLSNYFKTTSYWNWVKLTSMRSGQPGINGNEFARLLIPLPKITEQSAIATVLSDTDALIEHLEKLIAKKKAIKQGAMQQLLTGKKRLPGFSGKWEVKKLGEICWYQEGPGVRNYQFTASGVKLLNGTNISNGKVMLDTTNRYISEKEAFGWYKHFLVDEGDILIASSGVTIDRFHEKVAFASSNNLPLCMNTSTIRLKVNLKLLDKYLYFFLQSNLFKNQIGKQATGSAQLNFGPSHLKKIDIDFPPSIEEQTAIATILSDMDAEIERLEQKRDKYTMLKNGMMQQLLTGKIRLL